MKARPNLVAQQDIDEATGRDRVAEAQVVDGQGRARRRAGAARGRQGRRQSKTQTLFDYARITAPFAGVITHRYADTGAMIQAGTSSQTQAMPIVRLSENDRLRLVIPVPESAVSRVHVGATSTSPCSRCTGRVTGTVARFADRLDTDTRTMHVEVDVPNPKLELVPGMYADATLVLDAAKDALVAPVQAIDRDETGRARARRRRRRDRRRSRRATVALGLETARPRRDRRADCTPATWSSSAAARSSSPAPSVTPKLIAAATPEETADVALLPAQSVLHRRRVA